MTETGTDDCEDGAEAYASHTNDVWHGDGAGAHSGRDEIKHRRVGGAWLEERVALLRAVLLASVVIIVAGV